MIRKVQEFYRSSYEFGYFQCRFDVGEAKARNSQEHMQINHHFRVHEFQPSAHLGAEKTGKIENRSVIYAAANVFIPFSDNRVGKTGVSKFVGKPPART
jgi:hypothetical protein